MTELGVLVFIGLAVIAVVGLCCWWVRMIKRREQRLLDKEKEFKESSNYDNRKN